MGEYTFEKVFNRLQELTHYGMPRRSGRYPWGSGDNPYQHSGDFLSRVEELKGQGLSDTDIAKAMGLTTSQFRVQKALATDERRSVDVATARGLKEKGYSTAKIGEMMGKPESTVRSLLDENAEARMNQAKKTADFLKKQVEEKGMIDVGVGVERELGVSKEKLNQALYMLEMEGYEVYGAGVPQATNPGKQTNLKVLCPPGTEHKDIYNFGDIHSVNDYITYDNGETFKKAFVYPKSMDSDRLAIRYAEDGGIQKDGVIEIRRGVDDLSLGDSHYAQVRILVDNDRYLKGMAVYSDDLPDGVDVLFNTNKSSNVPMRDVLKKIKDDPDNPFGSAINEHGGQSYYFDKDGNEQLSLINKRADEGDWSEWSNKLPSQFLSKQNITLVKKQLNLATADKMAEYDEICSLDNPTVKKTLLKSFAEDCDTAAVHLYAAALPGQKYKVILPVSSIKETEVYAPDYDDGSTVALIRYPHGGTFEIPILKVNNRQAEAKKTLGNATDAVGINSKVAERLSGADFDGDTVMVIPCNMPGKVHITSTNPLKGLEGFDPKLNYGAASTKEDADGTVHYYRNGKEYRIMKATQKEMGVVSNLITDMTLKGATQDELARAVRHSMVVIDAEKHKLDYKQSEIDNGIASLKKKYQGTVDEDGRYHEGAATLISRAKSETTVLKRQGSPVIDPETGKQSWKTVTKKKLVTDPDTGKESWVEVDDTTYTVEKTNKKTGETTVTVKTKTQPSTKMAETDDAYTLVSDRRTPTELAYADYANKMKSLANQARKEMVNTGKIAYSADANEQYRAEVDSLNAKLNVSLKNAPRERQAQVMAKATVDAKKQDNPDMSKKDIKKASQQALTQARTAVGAKRETIKITEKEWEAIQAGAISESKLTQILNNTDIDVVRQYATPRATTTLSAAKVNRIKSMNSSGYTTAEIAKQMGISASTVSKCLNGKE